MRILPAILVALSVPAAVLYGCGGSVNKSSSSGDASPEATASEASVDSSSGHDAGLDAPPEGSGYVNQAPHCVRTDAGIPDPFDAGSLPDVVALTQVVNAGGSVLRHPTFVSVTFPGDTLADEVGDFTASVGCTDYWHAVMADYGVGEAVAGPPVALTEAAPTNIDDTGIAAWLAKKIESKDPKFPKPDAETVYALWYPDTTTISLQGATSCQSFGGYHNGTKLADGTPIAYAVIPRCPTQGGTVMDGLSLTASHELIEACTDPQPFDAPAYSAPDPNHSGWLFAQASEVGDMCEFDQSAFYQPTGFPWYVQKTYSNRAAWAGTNPCVPADSPTYFYAAAQVPDSVSLDLLGTGTPVPTAVVHVAVGSSVTIPVTLVGTSGVKTMGLQAVDLNQFTGQPTVLNMTLSASSGVPGDTVQLTIDKTAAEQQGGAGAFAIVTTIGQTQTFSIGLTTD